MVKKTSVVRCNFQRDLLVKCITKVAAALRVMQCKSIPFLMQNVVANFSILEKVVSCKFLEKNFGAGENFVKNLRAVLFCEKIAYVPLRVMLFFVFAFVRRV